MAKTSLAAPTRRMPARALTAWILLHVVIIVGAAVMFFPFLWTLITSISPGAGLTVAPALIPENPSLDAYARLFAELPFLRIVGNSIFLAIVTTLVQLFTSATAGYAFSRLPFRGRGAVFAVYLATMMIPLQVLIVPLFVELKAFGLLNSYLGALLPTFASVFGIFLLRQAISQVPRELDEAATLDGAGHFRIFFSVVLPNIRPALATLTVFAFMSSWNSFLWPLVVLRTFSKWAGLAGLRVGYGVMPRAMAHTLMQVKQPYGVSVAAEVAALAS
ncbi:MAG: aminotransferase class I/II-fold pyridoxal phosphate-dependent enzyme, partial [Rhodoglobus sp.]